MPTVTRITHGVYRYECQCGKVMTLDMQADERPKRLIMCFDCIKKSTDGDIIRELLTENIDTPVED